MKWPVGIGGKGNEGVAAYVKQIKGGIGYVELSYALQNKMNYTASEERAGNFVVPSEESFKAAAASADWNDVKDFYLVITNAPGAEAWPITATNFILMYKQPEERRNAARRPWRSSTGSTPTAMHPPRALDYVPLPQDLTKQIEAYWAASIK